MGKLVIGNIVSLHGANFSNYQSIPPNLQNENTSLKSWRKFSDWQHCPISINYFLPGWRVLPSSDGRSLVFSPFVWTTCEKITCGIHVFFSQQLINSRHELISCCEKNTCEMNFIFMCENLPRLFGLFSDTFLFVPKVLYIYQLRSWR